MAKKKKLPVPPPPTKVVVKRLPVKKKAPIKKEVKRVPVKKATSRVVPSPIPQSPRRNPKPTSQSRGTDRSDQDRTANHADHSPRTVSPPVPTRTTKQTPRPRVQSSSVPPPGFAPNPARTTEAASKVEGLKQDLARLQMTVHGTTTGTTRKLKPSEVLAKKQASLGEMTQSVGSASHGIVDAKAGTGKTFTSVLSVAYTYRDAIWRDVVKNLGFDPVPSPQQQKVWDFVAQEKPRVVRYIAFNRSIVKAFSVQYQWLVDALARIGVEFEFSTVHGMCYKVCGKAFRLKWGSTSKWKTRRLLSTHWNKDLEEVWKEKATVINAVEDLVGYAKINLKFSYEEQGYDRRYFVTDEVFQHLVDHYQVDLGTQEAEIRELTDILLDKSLKMTDLLDFNDQIVFPTLYDLRPWRKADLGLVDEAQDLNASQQEVIFRFLERMVLVGDPNQAIYGFAGADVDSIPNMTKRLGQSNRGVQEMKLTVTRRCGKKIVEEAQAIVPEFEAHDMNQEGEVKWASQEEAREQMTDRDMVLCRLNAPIVSLAFGLIRENRKCHIQGRDLGQQLKLTIKNSKATDPGEFLNWLDKYQETEMARLKKRRNVDPDVLIALEDKCAVLRVFFEDATSMEAVVGKGGKIDKVFQLEYEEGREPNEGIKLSSVHRAKGLEADRVYILRPEKMPHPMAKSAWARAQEMNLKYVAITRAIKELIWVRTPKQEM